MPTALLSASNTEGLVPFAKILQAHGFALLATAGTAKILRAGDINVQNLEDITGFGDFLGGRIKTLHPAVHAGLLARRESPEHMEALTKNGFFPIDLLVVTLYPFESHRDIEHIDIGGVALLRGGAKNYQSVTVLTDPADYCRVQEEIQKNGKTSLSTRKHLAHKAFARTAVYDTAISRWLAPEDASVYLLSGTLKKTLRYGENPHQKGAFYATSPEGFAVAQQKQGKHLSYNNFLDADAACQAVSALKAHAAVIIKHTSPCGAAIAPTLADAIQKARRSDPQSAFGGILAVNTPINKKAAQEIVQLFTEVVIAPAVDDDALRILHTKPRLRLLLLQPQDSQNSYHIRSIHGGFLTQTPDCKPLNWEDVQCVSGTLRKEWTEDLMFAWKICRHVKSNGVVLVQDGATVGIGGGVTSRVDAVQLALSKAQKRAQGAVAASDAFFPFADTVVLLAKAGVSAIIQPGGARRDKEIVAKAQKLGVCMLMTGHRHFRH